MDLDGMMLRSTPDNDCNISEDRNFAILSPLTCLVTMGREAPQQDNLEGFAQKRPGGL
jgi:hypothetical protein